MFTLRCTARLRKRLVTTEETASAPPSTTLGDWYAHLLFTRPQRYVAREAEGDERERLWKLATKLYSGYEDYQARATRRRIPVIVLEPARA